MAPPKTSTDSRALKRKVSSQILQLGRLTVYLEDDSDEVKNRVREVLKTVSPETAVVFLVIGKFAKQDSE
ncbi:hypothetical protein E6H34_10495 [Candidatus Bathyarchaeota archaeon]|nr:MAG: hypothetical protein E6H34_10495 [Candidatus Bathyarchaeota archaeon]